ncbi:MULTISPECIES: sigma 54-interacting transcriptional regulator [unclassified Enterococcus]|uniref:sigma 54-interacting transcriptional regulator n=1 Tax=unclassified Enterococcus TaxID=2608891 RepID=UPI0015549B13|nr:MULTISPECIES: sigma 54-interacting transcriptional regulator [unclassified Enterococcus]MBS7577987.1 sigma 54-interacting transcriptional regulator [Enterococcus sp. MMGLQ5-2]MBS7585152.1 sigma 54-interacting transcriptional regulator [Enterococcus sp. MMGLQ5-1]NPD13009.1 sigma 54-interacting transcriptional regulator [Enterococcus sp. MMGLQ5-1]NPD37817.1 sigma 54-interacting transcriptional regulator [Enterococcus sp. MMGLQ5-2]
MRRKDEIILFLKKKRKESLNNQSDFKITTLDISNYLSISRTAASRELNNLVRDQILGKEKGKPVKYFYLDTDSKNTLISFKNEKQNKSLMKMEEKGAFSNFIGTKGSMAVHMNLAKAAIMYPPNGLHTIILGSTGVGKTTFAKIMFRYGQEIGRFNNKSPFIHFNCSDYSNNPQLLLSVLFGYVKGAFTGADTDKFGLIEQVNHGVLFLDEIHRLPPEGQEMLFTIIDTRKYRRMGETKNVNRDVDILIICATTENIESSVLQTFKRRFPMVLTLPDLKDRSTQERLNLIDHFFCLESQKINLEILVKANILEYLSTYNCSGNIGQLKNDVQIFCAKEFAKAMLEKQERIEIYDENTEMKKVLQENKLANKKQFFRDSVYYHGQKKQKQRINYEVSNDNESSFYKVILEKYSNLLREGRSMKEIQTKINYFLDDFFSVDLKNDIIENPRNKGIEKLVSKEILVIVDKIIQEISNDLDIVCDRHVVYNLALHIEALVLKLQTSTIPYRVNKVIEKVSDSPLRKYADKLIVEVNNKMNVLISSEEQDIIELFLDTIYKDVRKNPIGILILMHGIGVATNLAKMVNDLLGINHAVGVDMPLDESVENVYKKVVEMVKLIDQGSGVLLLVDMGSLVTFPSKLIKDTGIDTMVVDNVTSPIIIDATRKALFANLNLNQLISELLEEVNYYTTNRKNTNIFDYSSRRLIKNKDHLFYHSLEKSVIFLNVYGATELLDEILISLSKQIKFEIIDTLVIKFYFHCLGMIERAIRKETLQFEVSENIKDELYHIIAKELNILERTYGTEFSASEILYVTKIIRTFI